MKSAAENIPLFRKWGENVRGLSRAQIAMAAAAAVELAYLVYSLWLFTVPLETYSFSGDELVSRYGVYMEDFLGEYGDGYYLDNSLHPDEDDEEWLEADGDESKVLKISTPEVNLRRGSYEITIHYSSSYTATYTSTAYYYTYPVAAGKKEVGFPADETQYTFTMTSPVSVTEYQVQTNYLGTGYLFVSNITISETSVWKQTNLALALFVFFMIDILAFLQCRPRTKWNPSQRGCACALLFLVMFTSIPALSFYAYGGHDLNFHLFRIESIKEALLDGQFPVRVSSAWFDGYGYASSVLYGELFLYIPAIMRIIGFSVKISYKFYLVLVNAATAFIAYHSFRKMSGSRYAAMAGTILYVLSPYRLMCMYLRGAVGEYTAIAFLPLVCYGLWRIYTDSPDSKEFRHNWVPAVLGYSGLIQSHVLSTLLTAIFTIILCVVLIRRTLQMPRFRQLLKTVFYTILLNCWFVVPFLDYIRSDLNSSEFTMLGRFRSNGAFLSDLLNIFPNGSGISYSINDYLEEETEMSYTIGGGLLAAGAVYLILRLSGKIKESRIRKTADLAFGLGILAMFMSTIYFPWDFIQQLNEMTAWLTQSMQFPWRFLGLASLLFAVVAVFLFYWLVRKGDRALLYIMTAVIVGAGILSGGYFLSAFVSNYDNVTIVQYEETLTSSAVMGGEYLPAGTDWEIFEDDEPDTEGRLTDLTYEKEDGVITISCSNETDSETYVDVSFLYYKGYCARDIQTGEELVVIQADTNKVRVIIPEGYSGTFEVTFEEPWYWRVSEVITLLTIICFLAGWCADKRKRMKETPKVGPVPADRAIDAERVSDTV